MKKQANPLLNKTPGREAPALDQQQLYSEMGINIPGVCSTEIPGDATAR